MAWLWGGDAKKPVTVGPDTGKTLEKKEPVKEPSAPKPLCPTCGQVLGSSNKPSQDMMKEVEGMK